MYVIPVIAGVLLSAATGLRIFLPLCALSWAGFFGLGEIIESLNWIATLPDWISTLPAALTFTAAVCFEVLADKIPVVDHALDLVGLVAKPLAAAVIMSAMLFELDPLYALVLAVAAGSTTALGVHAAKAQGRVAANASTLGIAAPFLSTAEDIFTFTLVLIALFLPVIALTGMLLLVVLLIRRRRRPKDEPLSV